MKKWIFLGFMLCIFSSQTFGAKVTFYAVPCIKPHSGYHYMTCSPIIVTVDSTVVAIPADFDTDLASIPRPIWPIIAPSRSDFIAPSILHDYLYTCHMGFERSQIDGFFYDALVGNGMTKPRAYLMYLMVRWFGGWHYDQPGTCEERLVKMVNERGRCTDMDVMNS